jgi:hypothetical protein
VTFTALEPMSRPKLSLVFRKRLFNNSFTRWQVV